jgi:hypothetical protein
VVEGEKDADRASDLGLLAVCNPEGAGRNKWKAEYTEQLRGVEAVVIADRDTQGRNHASAVAKSLLGSAHSVRMLELPGEGVKDLADWVAAEVRAGHGAPEISSRLAALLTDVPAWKPEASAGAEAEEDDEDGDQRKETQSQIMLRLAAAAGVELPPSLGCPSTSTTRSGRCVRGTFETGCSRASTSRRIGRRALRLARRP